MELNLFLDAMVKWGIPIVITGIFAFIAAKVAPPVVAWVNANSTEAQRDNVHEIIAQVIRTAEATRLKLKLENTAFDILKFALKQADEQLKKANIDIDEDGIANLIRAQLYSKLSWELPEDNAVAERAFGEKAIVPVEERLWA